MKTQPISEVLAAHPFFAGLTGPDLQVIADCAQWVRYHPGQFLFREGDEAHHFYLLRQGHVALQTSGRAAGTITLMTLGEGDILGWSWLIPPYKKQFDARAVDEVRAIVVETTRLRERCAADARFGYELLRRFATLMGRRLQVTRLQLLDVYASRLVP